MDNKTMMNEYKTTSSEYVKFDNQQPKRYELSIINMIIYYYNMIIYYYVHCGVF